MKKAAKLLAQGATNLNIIEENGAQFSFNVCIFF